MKLVYSFPIALMALSLPVLAQDGTFRADGTFALTYEHSSGGTDQTLGLADAEFGFSRGGFGVDLSLLAVQRDAIDTDSDVMGGLTYSFGNGAKIVVGMPRSGYDQFARFGIGETIRANRLVIPYLDTSFFSALTSGNDLDGYGLRFDSAKGGRLAYSVSASRDEDDDIDSLGFSGSFDVGGTNFAGGIEFLQGDTDRATMAKLRVARQFGAFTISAAGSHVGSTFSLEQTYVEAAAKYEPNDRIDVTGFVAGLDSNAISQTTLYGIGGRYYFAGGASAGASVTQYDSGATQVEVSVGLDF